MYVYIYRCKEKKKKRWAVGKTGDRLKASELLTGLRKKLTGQVWFGGTKGFCCNVYKLVL